MDLYAFAAERPEESSKCDLLFRTATNGTFIISGAHAFAFFTKSSLPNHVLGAIWDLVNLTNAPHLDRRTFYLFCKYVQLVQAGLPLTYDSFKLNFARLPSTPYFQGVPDPDPPRPPPSTNPFLQNATAATSAVASHFQGLPH